MLEKHEVLEFSQPPAWNCARPLPPLDGNVSRWVAA